MAKVAAGGGGGRIQIENGLAFSWENIVQ